MSRLHVWRGLQMDLLITPVVFNYGHYWFNYAVYDHLRFSLLLNAVPHRQQDNGSEFS